MSGIYKDFESKITPLTPKDTKNPERVGFEPTNSYLLNDFESFAFDHSATSPPFKSILTNLY